jgi:hypothetical protein
MNSMYDMWFNAEMSHYSFYNNHSFANMQHTNNNLPIAN